MTKKQMIEYIDQHYDWFEAMQMPLGDDSWWYTNRRPEDCIKVKIYSWIDSDKVLEKLSANEKKVMETIGFNLDEYLNDYIWSDFGLVERAREDLLLDLKDEYNVTDIEYGGRSGGWMAIIYSWDSVYSDYDSDEYSYKEIRAFYNTIKKAIAEHETVTNIVLDRKNKLEKIIKDVDTYIEGLQEYLRDMLESKQMQATQVLDLSL